MKHSTKLNKPNIGVITWAFNSIAGETILMNFINILEPLSNELFVITGKFPKDTISNKKIHIKSIKYKSKKEEPVVIKIIKYTLMQLRISFNLLKIPKNVDIVIFFLAQELLLPMISAKLLKKRVVIVATGSSQKSAKEVYKNRSCGYWGIILSYLSEFFEKINFALTNRIILYSPNLIKEWNLERYENKIYIAHRHFIDFDTFKMKKKFNERKNLIGYIGRLSGEKGTLNFVKAIPEISKERGEIKFLVGGDGQLRDEIEKYLDGRNLDDKVNLLGWIIHDELPDYLNELKLVVLPSYTEGLPNIMLEAMACGTPVLATPVGAIPDVIRDGETGFIMENNSIECIAADVMRALEHPDLERIVENARALVEREFTYEAAVERYRKILGSF